jgi:aryl-alcohol dehydrogenase-like predicted oxidoreductase
MKATTLGRSGPHLSRIALGTWQLGATPVAGPGPENAC